MSDVEAVPLTDFTHGGIEAREGRAMLIEAGLAGDLERAGLIRIKMSPQHANKMMLPPANKDAAGKAQDDGAGQPSSASLVAPVSRTTMSLPSAPGNGKRPRSGM